MERAAVDRRVRKNRKAIRNAFAELLTEKELNEITIKDIADRADINRKTFYAHYSGVHQLLDEIENELVSAFAEDLEGMDFSRSLENPALLFRKITATIDSDMEFYGNLMQRNDSMLIQKTVRVLKGKMVEYLTQEYSFSPETVQTLSEYTVSGISAAYQSWFRSESRGSIEYLSMLVSRMVKAGVDAAVRLEKNL